MKRLVFCGNRFNCIEPLLNLQDKYKLFVWAIEGSHLHKWIVDYGNLEFNVIAGANDFFNLLKYSDFDIFLSNGCPYIIPETYLLQNSTRQYINIHPSPLPELRGADPIPGAILFNKSFGATCHMIDAKIDAGNIIAQKEIINNDIEFATDMYPKIFQLEKEVFADALKTNFTEKKIQKLSESNIYYSFNEKDNLIQFSDNLTAIERRFRAFDNWNKGFWVQKDDMQKRRIVAIRGTAQTLDITSRLCSLKQNRLKSMWFDTVDAKLELTILMDV